MSSTPTRTDSELGNYFVAAYPPFSCWREDKLAGFHQTLDRPSPSPAPLGLYVHIPFCAERCHYCYDLSHSDKLTEIDAYGRALPKELSLYAGTPALEGRALDFVYFGGGTPSLLSSRRIEEFTRQLQRALPWTRAREVTFECAPKGVTESKCRALHESGVTRISMGVQQLDDDVLRLNGRVHLCEDVERAYALLRRVEFSVVNIDLIVGLVGETDESFLRSLDRVIRLAPESVTIYQLEIPFNTPLYREIRERGVESMPASWEVKRRRLKHGFARLEDAGYAVRSGYAAVRGGEQTRFLYQEEQYRGADLLGIGLSSFSYLDGVHQQNRTGLSDYLDDVSHGRLPLWRSYALNDEERLVREFVLQLKLGTVDLRALRRRFDADVLQRFAEPISRFEGDGWLTSDDDAVRLTRDGLLRVDELLPSFYRPDHRGVRYS
jgi:oxygen-independent coproporphyrinogen-3 oxidase